MTKDDYISRQAAINNIKNGFHWETVNGITAQAVLKQVIHDIEIMPSAQPEQRWIPVTESLPEDGQLVIFSTKTGRVHQGKYYVDNSVNQWYSALYKMRAWNNVVNAWMPLPEPYKERMEE